MKRVLVYGMTSNNGGIEAFLMNYFTHFNKERLVFDFVTDYEIIAWNEEIEKLGGKVYFIPSRRKNLFAHMKEIRKIIKNNGYKVVYYNLLSASGVFSVLASKGIRGVKTVVHSHNDNVGNLRVHKMLRPILNLISNYRLACSDDAGKFMFSDKVFNSGEVEVINNAIDTSKFRFDESIRKQVRDEFGFSDNFVIGHVGRMCYQKNSEFIIKIFNEVSKLDDNARLLYVGTGEDYEKVKDEINKNKLNDKVILAGMRNDVPKLYMGMDVFLLPSRFEGLAVVAVEAQTSGLICFASETVNKKTKMTDEFKFISLDKSAADWARNILNAKGMKRIDNSAKIKANGYDISVQVKELEDFFVDEVK